MGSLLLKDFYTLGKQMKIFLAMIVLFACVPGYSLSAFAMVYSAMLPITALAYDERSKWDSLAAMMPYSARDLVISKYVLGYILLFGVTLLSLAAQYVFAGIQGESLSQEMLVSNLLVLCVALLMQAISLPGMFKIGVEKGRMLLFITVALVTLAFLFLQNRISQADQLLHMSPSVFCLVFACAAVLLSAISIFLSVRFYQGKER